MTLTVGSLFAGIGGLELGLERAGMTVRWQVEIDPYARRVLAKHWPAVARHEDVRAVGARVLEPVDLICGGFPCQDISNAGKRAGIGGERSGLWAEYARIVRELRPKYVLVENVAVLRSRGLGVVLGDLAASGYDAEWDCIPAAAVGAPHLRDRIFIVATRRGVPDAERDGLRVERERVGEQRAEPRADEPRDDGAEGDVADSKGAGLEGRRVRGRLADCGETLAYAHGGRLAALGAAHDDDRGDARGDDAGRCGEGRFLDARAVDPSPWWEVEPDVGRVAHGVPARVDRLRALGNAVVPQVAEWIGRRIVAHAEGRS